MKLEPVAWLTRDGEPILLLPGANILVAGYDGHRLFSIYTGELTRHLNCFEESFVIAALAHNTIPKGYMVVPVEHAQDSERLNWIQDNARCDPKMDGNHMWHPLTWNQAKKCVGNNIRAAIDAAIEGEQ